MYAPVISRREARLAFGAPGFVIADSLNVINRMPQGAPFNDSYGWADSVDATHPFHFKFMVPSNVLKLNYAKLSFALQAFRAFVSGAPAVTSGAGSAHSHSVSGQSTSSQSSGNSSDHSHALSGTNVGSNFAGNNPVHYDGVNNLLTTQGANGGPISAMVSAGEQTLHTHNVPSTGVTGATSTSESAHTHSVTPSLTYGIFEGATATGVTVKVNGTDRTSALGGGSGFTGDQTELEIGQWLTVGQFNTVDLTPTGLGRIVAHLRLTGYIQSA